MITFVSRLNLDDQCYEVIGLDDDGNTVAKSNRTFSFEKDANEYAALVNGYDLEDLTVHLSTRDHIALDAAFDAENQVDMFTE